MELDSVNHSFERLVYTFSKDVILQDEYGLEYSSDFSICGEKGVLEVTAEKTNFRFIYDAENYIGTGDDFQRRFDGLFKELKFMFLETHYPTFRFLGADETSYEFYERGKDASNSDRTITILLSKRPGFMKVFLLFTSRNKEKKPF